MLSKGHCQTGYVSIGSYTIYTLYVHAKDRQISILQVYVLYNSISVSSGWWETNNEILWATEPRLRFERFPPAGIEPKIAINVDDSASDKIYWGLFEGFVRIDIFFGFIEVMGEIVKVQTPRL